MEELNELVSGVVARNFGGDKEAYDASVKEAFREKVSWSDIETAATTLPELESAAKYLVQELLGFLPPAHVTVKHEPFLRAVINQYRSGLISWEKLIDEVEPSLKEIRNKEVEDHTCLKYPERIYQEYETFMPQYKQQIKERLIRFIGYEPKLEHSIAVELILRKLLLKDDFRFPEEMCSADIQAIQTVRYREVLFGYGKKAADESPLIIFQLFPDKLIV